MMRDAEQYPDWAHWVLRTEALGLSEIADTLDSGLVHAVDALLHCRGCMVITGMGKPGHIGRKTATTMASIGAPASFIHPAEAAHGGLGMVADNDVVVVIPSSGENDEITAIIPTLKRRSVTLIGIMARPVSTLAHHTDIRITAAVPKETCPFGLAPTTSATAAMALGNALAVVLLRTHASTLDDLALSHPTGSLDERLLLRVADIMHGGDALPAVVSDTLPKEAIMRTNEKGLGMLVVIDEAGRLKGVLTDGGLHRLFQQRDNFADPTVDDIMHTSLKTIIADKLVTEALKHMQINHINGLSVTEADDTLTGALSIHDLLMARIV